MAQNRLNARLRVYAPNGAVTGSLPHPLSWEMSAPLNDMPSLTVTYPKSSASVALLENPCEVSVEIGHPLTHVFTEYPGCRFLNLRRSHDMIARPETISYTMPSYGWMLRKTRFTNATALNAEGRRAFKAVSPGTVMKAVIDEAKARGNIPGLTYAFTAAQDSAGVAWPSTFTGDFDFGQDAWSILDALSNQGYVDYRFNGRALELYAPDTTLYRNLATDGGIILHSHADHLEEPVERTWEDVAQALVVVGDRGKSVLVTNASALQPWGKWEETLNAGGVIDTTQLTDLGTRVLATRAESRIQHTKQLSWREGLPVPFIDYRPGDRVRARSESGNQLDVQRIYQITLSTQDPYGLTVHLVLNDRFMDRALRNDRWINRVTGTGGPGAGGGTGGGTMVSGNKKAPALTANFLQGSAAAARYAALTYRVDIEGNLHVVGHCRSSIARAAGAYTLFTLPSGYEPQDLYSSGAIHVSSGDVWKTAIRVNIDNNGQVNFSTPVAIAANDGFYINMIIPRN